MAIRGVGARRLHLELLDGVHGRRVRPAAGAAVGRAVDQELVVPGPASVDGDRPVHVPGPRPREALGPELDLGEERACRLLEQHVDLASVERQLRDALVLHGLGERRLVRFRLLEAGGDGHRLLDRSHRELDVDVRRLRRPEDDAFTDVGPEAEQGGRDPVAAGGKLLYAEVAVGVGQDLGRHVRVDVGHAHRHPGHESALGIGDGACEGGVDLLGPERAPGAERDGEQQGDAPDRAATGQVDVHRHRLFLHRGWQDGRRRGPWDVLLQLMRISWIVKGPSVTRAAPPPWLGTSGQTL